MCDVVHLVYYQNVNGDRDLVAVFGSLENAEAFVAASSDRRELSVEECPVYDA